MDLGLRGRRALVMGGSRGMGKACAMALAAEGAEIVLTARTRAVLEATAAEIAGATGAKVTFSAGDLRTPEGRAAAIAACPAPDILVTNCQGPAPGDFRGLDRDDWIAAFDDIFFAPIEMIKACYDGMVARRYGRIVSIASRSVKNPQGDLPLSNGARGALHGFLAGIARRGIASNVTINTLAPGMFATDAQRRHVQGLVAEEGKPFETIWAERQQTIPAGRFGEVEEIAATCAFLCSRQAGYMTGQVILVDGGNFPGTM